MTVNDVAKYLVVSTRTVHRWIAAGDLAVIRLPGPGKRIRVPRVAVELIGAHR